MSGKLLNTWCDPLLPSLGPSLGQEGGAVPGGGGNGDQEGGGVPDGGGNKHKEVGDGGKGECGRGKFAPQFQMKTR